MSNSLAPDRILDLVKKLRAAAEDAATRSEALAADVAVRSARERQRCETALKEHAGQTEATLAEAHSLYLAHKSAIQTNFENRKTRIGRAYQSSKEQRLNEIENSIGGRKYHLQKNTLQAERDRDAALAAQNQAHEEFKATLAAEHATLAQLEAETQRAFKGYSSLLRAFFKAYDEPAPLHGPDHQKLLEQLRGLLGQSRAALDRFSRRTLLSICRYWGLWLTLFICAFAAAVFFREPAWPALTLQTAGAAAGGALVLFLGARYLALGSARSDAASLSNLLASARRTHDASLAAAETHHKNELQRIKDDFIKTTQAFDQELKRASVEAGQARVAIRMNADERTVAITQRHEQLFRVRLQRLEKEYAEARASLEHSGKVNQQVIRDNSDATIAAIASNSASEFEKIQSDWQSTTHPISEQIARLNSEADTLFPPWSELTSKPWTPPPAFVHTAKFGQLAVDISKVCQKLPKDPHLTFPDPAFTLPLCLVYPDTGSIVFETKNSGQQQVIESLNNIILRLLAGAPPGKLNFTIIDPVGLGQNFAGVMHMADYEEQIISSRIWTQSGQIEQRLADLNEHMEKVIQMYLRNEYQDITEYNKQAGVIAEKYHFLVIADFPAGFTDSAAKRLLSIAASGARCGVYTLIHWDQRQPLPQDFLPDELRKTSLCLTARGNEFVLTGKHIPGTDIALDAPPSPELATAFIHNIGTASRDSSRVEVPFEHIAPAPEEVWSSETSKELRVPIGRTGATKLQYLEIGKGTCQHGLIAGKTGSGKSTLFHVIITNLSLWCSPDQVEFYLVDFKKGVEFKSYASRRLPHARVVAIESDREFGLSVLQRVDDELKRRGDLFRQLGVQDVPGYKRAGGTESMPRCLLMIDEFQEFFVEDDKIGQTASLLLDRIVRQGRAFGIHVLLGSQTLGGAYTVARTTLGQMVIRIALQCNEADAYLIMDDSNPAPRLLSRPGEAIYNDAAGALEGNSPFQIVWLPEPVRDDYLAKIRARADQVPALAEAAPIVFEGNAPADVRENTVLAALLRAPAVKPTAAPRIWIGAPNSIKGPTEPVFLRQSGNNLLMVGQREEAILALFAVGLVSLAAQYPIGACRLILCETTPPGTPHRAFIDSILQAIPTHVTRVKPAELEAVMTELGAELKQRVDDPEAESAPPRFLFLHGLQKLNRLRYEEDFGFSSSSDAPASPGATLNQLIMEGPRVGFHVIASCDTYNNVNRFLSRKALSEFEMRVLFQMSANDSASLVDSPKASLLGLHRALFFNAQEGYQETFRPYALPDQEWIALVARELGRLLNSEKNANTLAKDASAEPASEHL